MACCSTPHQSHLEACAAERPRSRVLPHAASQVSRLLAPKFGSFLTFGALRAGKESAPGQPTLTQLRSTYRLSSQARGTRARHHACGADAACTQGGATRVLGVIGKPISHSRSPVLHNAALQSLREDIVYVPLLVDDLPDFLHTPLFGGTDFAGFSVTIPHKEVALRCCAEVRAVRDCTCVHCAEHARTRGAG